MNRCTRALSNLYLHAVLPSLTELVNFDAEAREIIAPWNIRLSLRVIGAPAVILQIRDGEIHFSSPRRGKVDVSFVFLTHRHLNAFFNGKKWAVPLVTRGLWRINFLKSFALLAERLSSVLEDRTSTTPLYTRLAFLIGGLGLLPLAQFDTFSQAILEKTPHGLAEFSIENENIPSIWFENCQDSWLAGQGPPPRLPDVRVRFADINIANATLRNDIDTLAAVGSQRIIIEGLSPLAEGLELIMERLNFYLAR